MQKCFSNYIDFSTITPSVKDYQMPAIELGLADWLGVWGRRQIILNRNGHALSDPNVPNCMLAESEIGYSTLGGKSAAASAANSLVSPSSSIRTLTSRLWNWEFDNQLALPQLTYASSQMRSCEWLRERRTKIRPPCAALSLILSSRLTASSWLGSSPALPDGLSQPNPM